MTRDVFTSTRIKLSLWYTLIILLITGSMSLLFYHRASLVIQQQQLRLQQRIDQEPMFGPPESRLNRRFNDRFLEDIQDAKHDLIRQLILINTVIGTVIITASYFLAGKTLEPIKKTLEEQKRFVGDAAHELRTPLTSLKTTIEVSLMDDKLSQSAKKILQENLEDINGLESLTNGLLKLSQIDGQQLQLQPLSLNQLVKQSIKQASPQANKKNITIITTIPKIDIQISGDKDAIHNLVLILIDNAIKYSSPKTKIIIKLKQNKHSSQLIVKDHGIGIAKHHVPFVFDRFYRADSSRSKSTISGYGLGLALAKKIVQEHHGDIHISSQLEKGTEVSVIFPSLKSAE